MKTKTKTLEYLASSPSPVNNQLGENHKKKFALNKVSVTRRVT